MKKNILVSWSGGIDSTALILRLLKAGHKVSAIYTEIPNNGAKVLREKTAIDNIIPYFQMYDFKFIGTNTISLNGSSDLLELQQPIIWLTSLIYAEGGPYDEVHIGYILNDCAISWISEMQAIWKAYLKFGKDFDKKPVLIFPLIKVHKIELWNELPVEILKHVTWCENENEPPEICECNPCKKMSFIGLKPLSKS